MMFERSFNLHDESKLIRDLVNDSIVNNIVTEDLSDNGKSYGTNEIGDWITEKIERG